jgi:hypothetical protein
MSSSSANSAFALTDLSERLSPRSAPAEVGPESVSGHRSSMGDSWNRVERSGIFRS